MAVRSMRGGAIRGGAIRGGGIGSGGVDGCAVTRSLPGGPVFTVPADRAPGATTATAAGEAAALAEMSLTAMLALQTLDRPTVDDRRARRHAQTMLDALRDLQLDLLGGEASPDRLHSLKALVDTLPVATHPGLRAATLSVALRIELELVRHTAALNA